MFTAIFKLINYLKWYLYHKWFYLWASKKGISLDQTTMIKGKCKITSGNIKIGPETIIQSSSLDGRGGLIIGRNVIIDQATIITAQHDIDSPLYPTVFHTVEIGDYAILYKNSMVLPGRKIGRGAIVGAGAVVSKDVPDMAVVVGNPAHIVRYRENIHSECDLLMMGGYNINKQVINYLKKFKDKKK